MPANAFDDTSGKWPGMAASLLVCLSAGILRFAFRFRLGF
jgi:hypothetical protein